MKTQFRYLLIRLGCVVAFLLSLAVFQTIHAQGAVVPMGSPVYRLLERAENKGLLTTPLSQLRPLSRKEIAAHLMQLDSVVKTSSYGDHGFTKVDQEQLKELLREFSYEINRELPKSDKTRIATLRHAAFRWLPNAVYGNGEDFVSTQDGEFRIRINPRFRYDVGGSPDDSWNGLRRMGFGWSLQADWQKNLSVSFRYNDYHDKANSALINHTYREWGGNGISEYLVSGETPSSVTRNPFDTTQRRSSEDYIISTTSIGYQLGRLHILAGREPVSWGPGERQQLSLGSQVSPYDQIRLDFDLSNHFRFIYVHGWLRAFPPVQDTLYNPDDVQTRKLDRPKYVAAHRLEWHPSKSVTLGFAEAVVYGDRAPDLAYLIPVNLYFASEENRGDNDNKSVTFDFTVRPVSGTSVYGGIWVDDLTFGKVGTSYIQNKFGYLAGALVDDPFRLSNTRFFAEYTRMDPYAGGHYYAINRYENWGRPLGLDLPPDADQLAIHGEWAPGYRWHLAAETEMMRHIETAQLNGIILTPGSTSRMYPQAVQNLDLPWGVGQGQYTHSYGISGRYEFLEHFWLAFSWQRQRMNFFNTQPGYRLSYLPDALQHRPGLFDWGDKTFKYTNTFWTISLLINPDR